MSLRRAHALLVLAVLLTSLCSTQAGALDGAVLLAFGAAYPAPDGSSSTHRGIDVAVGDGALIDAPVSGQVRFAGRIPGPGGESVWCVSIDSDRGIVSLLPLEGVSVSKGDSVDAGDPIAHVASDGDPSSADPHLHLGLKSGDVYLDPSPLLAPAAAQAEADGASPLPEAETQQAAAHAPVKAVTAPSATPAPQPLIAPGAVVAGTPAPMPSTAGVTPLTEVPVAGQPGVSVPAPVPAAGASSNGVSARTLALPTRIPAVTASGVSHVPVSAGAKSRGLSAWKPATAPALAVLGAAVAAATMIVTRRALVRRTTSAGPVSDRLGILLQHLKAGDTLCGLTSCSGPLPSQSRGH